MRRHKVRIDQHHARLATIALSKFTTDEHMVGAKDGIRRAMREAERDEDEARPEVTTGMCGSITDHFKLNSIIRAAMRAIVAHDGGQILICCCGDCERLQTWRTDTPGEGYCDNHGWGQGREPEHVRPLRAFNARVYP